MVIGGMVLLAIQVVSQIDFSNKIKKTLDVDDIDKNIYKVAIEGNLSPKQIDTIKASLGKQKKKDKGANASIMQTRNFLKNKSRIIH